MKILYLVLAVLMFAGCSKEVLTPTQVSIVIPATQDSIALERTEQYPFNDNELDSLFESNSYSGTIILQGETVTQTGNKIKSVVKANKRGKIWNEVTVKETKRDTIIPVRTNDAVIQSENKFNRFVIIAGFVLALVALFVLFYLLIKRS